MWISVYTCIDFAYHFVNHSKDHTKIHQKLISQIHVAVWKLWESEERLAVSFGYFLCYSVVFRFFKLENYGKKLFRITDYCKPLTTI